MRKMVTASVMGTIIEYYDFTLYTTATAMVFNKIFFPGESPLIGSLAAFATYFVGYCARPLGEGCLAILAIASGAKSR